MKRRASQQLMDDLHGEFAGFLKDYIQRASRITNIATSVEGEPAPEPNGSVLNVIRGFLKDNGIALDPIDDSKRGDFEQLMKGLDSLPFQTDQFSEPGSGGH